MTKCERLQIVEQSARVVELERRLDELEQERVEMLSDIHSIWVDELDPLVVLAKWD